MKEIAEKL
jgi:hypothetical protein